jgi:hypothetical protein
MFFILVFLALTCLGVAVWAIADIASTPDSAFVGAGLSKLTWLVLIAVFLVVAAPVALVLSIVYLSSVRPRLIRAV